MTGFPLADSYQVLVYLTIFPSTETEAVATMLPACPPTCVTPGISCHTHREGDHAHSD